MTCGDKLSMSILIISYAIKNDHLALRDHFKPIIEG